MRSQYWQGILFAATVACGSHAVLAQTRGSGTTSTTTTVPSQTSKPGSTPNYAGPNDNLPAGFQPTPQFVNGKVMLDDGTAPPDTVSIERLCGSTTYTEGHTDPKGVFGIELGRDQLVQDVSYNGGAVRNPNQPQPNGDHAADPNRPYRECELRANLPGYRSDSISLANFRPGQNPNLGTIILHKMGNVDGTVISATAAAAPHNAVKEYEHGMDAAKKGKTDEAAKAFAKAAQLYPEYAAAWLELGKLQVGRGEVEAGRQSFQAAAKAEPKFINPYLELGQMAYRSKNWQELADFTDKVAKLDPYDYPESYFLNGVANYSLKRMDLAEKSFRDAEKLDTSHRFPKTHQFLAGLLVQKNDLTGAVEELNSYLKYAPNAPDADVMRRQLAQVEQAARH